MMCVSAVGLTGQWFKTQALAAHLANSQAKFGGYTTTANQVLYRFVAGAGDSLQVVEVNVSAPGGPVPYGTTVTAEVRAVYHMQIGGVNLAPVPITGKGQAVSAYWPGVLDVRYTYPNW